MPAWAVLVSTLQRLRALFRLAAFLRVQTRKSAACGDELKRVPEQLKREYTSILSNVICHHDSHASCQELKQRKAHTCVDILSQDWTSTTDCSIIIEEYSHTSKKREQATQSTRWMPRCIGPKKDAETGETFRGSCIQAMSPENPNGATHPE